MIGCRLVLKHLPDCPLLLEPRLAERAKRVFEHELVAWESGQVRLATACLVHARDEYCCEVDALTLMMTSQQWIPLQHVAEADVVAKLVAERRAFVKPMRYDAPKPERFTDFLLLDAGARPIALDILRAFAGEAERSAKLASIGRREPRGWVWDTARDSVPPALPPKAPSRAG
jgi:hypothetical protein